MEVFKLFHRLLSSLFAPQKSQFHENMRTPPGACFMQLKSLIMRVFAKYRIRIKINFDRNYV